MKNKIVVSIMGGLGHQMFQYAMYLNLVKKYGAESVRINTDYYNYNQSYSGYELEKVFGIKLENTVLDSGIQVNESPAFFYHEDFFELPDDKNYLLVGYYQHFKYILNVEKNLRKDFVFSKELEKEFEEVIKDMTESNSVAIHLRRGDFQYNQTDNSPITYYKDAVEEIQKSVSDPKFFIFSDDINFAKEKFVNLPNKVFMSANYGENSYKDMFLMSKCKNFIIAPNSSFSYWGAWLSKNEDKIALMGNGPVSYPGFKRWGEDFAVKKETLFTKQRRIGKNLFICYALYDETGYTAKYIAASIRSIADNTEAKLNFVILHAKTLSKCVKENFTKLAKDIGAHLNFMEMNPSNENKNYTDRRKFAESIYPLFSQNYQPKDNEKIIFMLSPQIFDKDIIKILKENNLDNKKGILPLFKRQYENLDFGEATDEILIKNLTRTPFNNEDLMTRILSQFKTKENEKVYSVRAVYNSLLKAKHRVFFTTEKRYKDYIEEHLFNEETDKIFFVEGNQMNVNEFRMMIENLGEKTFVALFSEAAFQVIQLLKKWGKIDGVDFTDARGIFTEEEGGFPKTNLNLLFRDI